jgi:formate dehydrogenase major subunit
LETVKINIDGRELEVDRTLSVLDVARQAGIDIPTLCYHRDLERYAACRVCLVEVEKARGPMPACVTQVMDGMVIKTRTEEIDNIRRVVLELLLSEHYGDCVAPCKIACPAGIDIQGQIALIADGRYEESLIRIKESNPLPLVCGRVCPRFCEQKCRRNLIEGPVGINMLKRFVADYDMNSDNPYTPELKAATGKKVAVIGGGPAGLSAAYYLVQEGHQVDIYEAHPKLGGMLRYGIPEYRLPKATLDKEIEGITKLCGKVEVNSRFGKDYTIDSLKKDGYDAVFVAIGAQSSSSMRVEGEDSPGVLSGIDFLRNVVMGNETGLGKKVAVVGGGNTAMDAARTALRMGAKVTVVYRRSRAEMPANAEEVEQAEEEGVEFVFLSAPVSIKVANGRVNGLECNRMELGEPDASGRRRPVPIEGSEYVIELDTIIAAIGQSIDNTSLPQGSSIELNKWGYPVIDEETMLTSVEGVFSGGDCTAGPATAVEAIGAGKRAATYIDMYLSGNPVVAIDKPYSCSKGDLYEVRDSEFADVPTQVRAEQEALAPDVRVKGFAEIELGLTESQALEETKRCLQCGCQDAYECKLREYATEYKVDDSRYGARQYLEPRVKDVQNFLNRDYNKCITCGMCVRMCQEVRGQGAVAFINRGSATVVGTAFGATLEEAGCKFCAACVDACPTGALLDDKNRWRELPDNEVATICPYCGVGCQLILETKNNKIIRSVPDDNGPANLGQACVKGRFGLTFVNSDERLTTPLIKKNGKFAEATWDEALALVAKKFAQYDGSQFAAISSAKATNEDNYVMQKFTRGVMGTNSVDHCARL